jgi:hypothetical protein
MCNSTATLLPTTGSWWDVYDVATIPLALAFTLESGDPQPLEHDLGMDTEIVDAEIADSTIIARGGQGEMPPPGELFSGSRGQTVAEASQGLRHGTVRTTTAGQIRASGGTVDIAPEFDNVANAINHQHVNICLGPLGCTWSDPFPNPFPKSSRFGGIDYPFYEGYP